MAIIDYGENDYIEAVRKINSGFNSFGEIKEGDMQVGEVLKDLENITTSDSYLAIGFDSTEDKVNHPNHYTQGGIEAIDAIEAAVTGLVGSEATNTSNVLKYMWRWKFKNGVEDIKKAIWYAVRLCFSIDKVATVEHLKKLLKEYENKL